MQERGVEAGVAALCVLRQKRVHHLFWGLCMGGACSKRPRVAPANAKGEGGNNKQGGGKGSVKGGSVAGGSAVGHNKGNAAASTAGGGYQNQVLAKIKQDTANMGVTGVNASLGLDYIRMENKLLEQNISRVLSMVGKDGRTVRAHTRCCSATLMLRVQVTTTIALKLYLREEDCLKTPAESMMIDSAFSMENGVPSKREERRQVQQQQQHQRPRVPPVHTAAAAPAAPQVRAGDAHAGGDFHVRAHAYTGIHQLEGRDILV